eukprot:9498301-Pyramimonas_sp.AAC.2
MRYSLGAYFGLTCGQVLAGKAADKCTATDRRLYSEALSDIMRLVGPSLLAGSAWISEPDDEGMTILHALVDKHQNRGTNMGAPLVAPRVLDVVSRFSISIV